MEYKVVNVMDGIGNFSNGVSGFEEEVNGLISEGWRPQGGIQVIYHESGRYEYYQAMVKHEDT